MTERIYVRDGTGALVVRDGGRTAGKLYSDGGVDEDGVSRLIEWGDDETQKREIEDAVFTAFRQAEGVISATGNDHRAPALAAVRGLVGHMGAARQDEAEAILDAKMEARRAEIARDPEARIAALEAKLAALSGGRK